MLHHAAVQGAQGHAACGWHERVKREWVLGQSAENFYRWVWAGRTACVAGRPLETMHQPMGGWAMRGHFKSAQISRGCFAAIADDREGRTNASYRSDSGRIKRYVVHRNRATDYSESDVARPAQSKREGGFYRLFCLLGGCIQQPLVQIHRPTAKRIPEQRFRPIGPRPAKAPLLLVRVATAL